jgi:hypothetical protein
MTGLFWLAVCGFALAVGGILWYGLRKFKGRQLAEEERLASFMAATAGKARLVEAMPVPAPAAAPVAGDGLAQQKLLFEAAHKAGEAGEPALAIQLYARLLARYPQSGFAVQARTAVEAQKKKLAKA